MNNLVYTNNVTVSAFHLDDCGRYPLGELCRRFQETADSHAEQLQASTEIMARDSLGWLLAEMVIECREPLFLKKCLRIETRAAEINRKFFVRDFSFYADNCLEPSGGARTFWVLFDLQNQRIANPQKHFPERVLPDVRPAVDITHRKRLGKLKNPEPVNSITVRRHDQDIYKHVNNTRYVDWLTESTDDETWRKTYPSQLHINYRKPSVFGDTLSLQAEADCDHPHTSLFAIYNSENTEIVRASVTRKELP